LVRLLSPAPRQPPSPGIPPSPGTAYYVNATCGTPHLVLGNDGQYRAKLFIDDHVDRGATILPIGTPLYGDYALPMGTFCACANCAIGETTIVPSPDAFDKSPIVPSPDFTPHTLAASIEALEASSDASSHPMDAVEGSSSSDAPHDMETTGPVDMLESSSSIIDLVSDADADADDTTMVDAVDLASDVLIGTSDSLSDPPTPEAPQTDFGAFILAWGRFAAGHRAIPPWEESVQ
jgi:hypothetical protein